jgi:pimeloyl-ACP methyl ester carboxylesterase
MKTLLRGVLLLLCVGAAVRAEADSDFRAMPKSLKTSKGVAIEADGGTLLAPENRAKASSRKIAIGYLRLKSRAPSPKAPLFFLNGGPGSRAVSESPGVLDFWSPFLDVCDVVLIDQRGTNDSLLVWDWDGPLPLDFFTTVAAAARHMDAMHRKARDVFRQRGVDLAGYNTVESATDLDQLRAALGYERVSLLGFSYGTHLASAYLKAYGGHVENAVLFGVENLNETQKLPWAMDVQMRKLALLVAQDPRIGAQVSDLMALYDRLIAKLAKQPMKVSVPGPTGDTLSVPIGPFGLAFILRVDVGDATDLPVFPRLLWTIDHGDPSMLAWFVRKRVAVATGVHGMNEAMDEASGVSAARAALIAEQTKTSRFADVVNFPYPSVKEELGVPDLGDAYRAPLVSQVRTLIVSGELDFNTPPYQSEELRWGLPNATHLVVLHAGHEQTFFGNETAVPVVLDFLKGQDVSQRTITYPPLRFAALEGPETTVRHPSLPH